MLAPLETSEPSGSRAASRPATVRGPRGTAASITGGQDLTLDPADFTEIQALARARAGLNLTAEKAGVVQFRVATRVRALGMSSFREYLERARRDPDEVSSLVEALANNNTSFFRESEQHPLLRAAVAQGLRTCPDVRIWSAGCSTGEEPLTLAMLVRAWNPTAAGRVRILATDLSREAVAVARGGRYTDEQVGAIPAELRDRFASPAADPGWFDIAPEVRRSVRFARLNLLDPWPMRRRLHVIFCRNVMIYFDRATQRRLVGRFCNALEPGGYLFLGQAEALPPATSGLAYLDQAVYRKVDE
jgi:chemotaxis protein methyltransferase CheR